MRAGPSLGVLAAIALTACGVAPVPSPSQPSLTAPPPTVATFTFPVTPVLQTARPTPPTATPIPTTPQIETAPPPSAPIRTVDMSGGGSVPLACAGIGLIDATLQGHANDPRVAWIEIKDHGTEGVLFPKGFTARFTPYLEILDASGQVKFRAGSVIDGGCVWGQQDLLIGWP